MQGSLTAIIEDGSESFTIYLEEAWGMTSEQSDKLGSVEFEATKNRSDAESDARYQRQEAGKQLISDEEKLKLSTLENYDDSQVLEGLEAKVSSVEGYGLASIEERFFVAELIKKLHESIP